MPPIMSPPTKSVISTANALSVPQFLHTYLPSLPPFTSTNNNKDDDAISYPIALHTARTLARADFEACFALIRDTSAEMYKQSAMGWKPGAKKREMCLEAMRYLVVKRSRGVGGAAGGDNNDNNNSNNKEEEGEGEEEEKISSREAGGDRGKDEPAWEEEEEKEKEDVVVGFLSFMLTIEDNFPVIYCYEIHLQPSMRGCGLGAHLMGLVEEIGRRVGVDKAMLTVFLRNKGGMKFYEKIGYTEDEFSPSPKRLRNGKMKRPGYAILSKGLK